jgi:uncharacterized membrane protein
MPTNNPLNKIKVPKVKLSKLDWSKFNLRKVNSTTILAILSYLYILVLIPIIFGSKKPFIQYHTRQGMALLVLWVLFSFSFFLPLLPWIIGLFIIVCIVVGIINVVTGHERPLPLIGKLAIK